MFCKFDQISLKGKGVSCHKVFKTGFWNNGWSKSCTNILSRGHAYFWSKNAKKWKLVISMFLCYIWWTSFSSVQRSFGFRYWVKMAILWPNVCPYVGQCGRVCQIWSFLAYKLAKYRHFGKEAAPWTQKIYGPKSKLPFPRYCGILVVE